MDPYPVKSEQEGFLERKILDFKNTVGELIAHFYTQVELGQFLQVFLIASIKLMDGVSGNLWVRRGEQFGLAFNVGESKDMVPDLEGDHPEEFLLSQIANVMKPYVSPLTHRERENRDSSHYIGIYIPITAEGRLFGILKVVKVSESKVLYKEDVEFLLNLSALVQAYLNHLQLPKLVGRIEEIGKLFEVHKEIFSSLDPDQIAFALVNFLPEVVHCERCTVGFFEKKTLKVKAITGQDLIEQKSVVIRSLTKILEEAAKKREGLRFTYEDLEKMEEGSLKEAAEDYFHENPFKVFYAIPIQDKEKVFGAISIETTKEEGFSQTDLTFLKFVSEQATLALKNAKLFHSLPLMRSWQKILEVNQRIALLPTFKKVIYPLLILAFMTLPFLVPVENKIKGQCEILPIQRYYVRPWTDGILKTFLVREGSTVKKGDVVALLDDEPFQKRLREAMTRRDTIQANIIKYFGKGQMADYEAERLKLKEVEVEIEFLQSELKKTKIVSEGSGIVITPQPRFAERIGKPLTKGEELIEIGEIGDLRLEVAVEEKDIKFVKSGQKIQFLLNSLPEKSFEVLVEAVRQKAEVREGGNFFIVEANLKGIEEPFKPGMKGVAKIFTGKAPVVEVYLRDMIDWVKMKIFKWF
ncbi:MAG: GAF domain-containing protein [Candidatus Methanomethylicaceae archaeon]